MIKYRQITDISLVTDTISIYRNNRYLKHRYRRYDSTQYDTNNIDIGDILRYFRYRAY